MPLTHKFSPQVTLVLSTVILLNLSLLNFPNTVWAHAGHGNEFKGANEANQEHKPIAVDAETANRIGIKVEPVKAQRLAISIKTTGQIETLPNQQVEVRAPINGTLVELLVKPGDRIEKNQPVAVLSSPELAQLRVESLAKRAEAEADLQQAQADLKLAQGNYDRQVKIAASEISQAKSQLVAIQQQFERDQELVNKSSVVASAKENYQRQIEIATAEIAHTKAELAVAEETYEQDQKLVKDGAIPRRTMLESQAKLAAAKAALTKALQRQNVIQAETEIKQAEVEIPLRDLRESQGKMAEIKAQLTKALSRREVLEAENQLKRAQTSIEVSQSRIRLADAAYQARLKQLGIIANDRGLVTVLAPISGTVADREITLGESVNVAEKPLMTLLNDSRVFATGNVYEKDLNQIQPGQKVIVKIASLPNRTFTGIINLIGSVVEGESRVIPVKAEIDNIEGFLKPNMFVELEILTSRTATEILAIPTSAIVEANGKKLVYLQNGNAFQSVEVVLGQSSGNMIEVKNGLFEGDLIVTQRAPQLYAQSLRGDSNHSESDETKELNPKVTEANFNSLPVPLWALLGGGIGMASLTFAAGFIWGKETRKDRKFPSLAASQNHLAKNDFSASKPIFKEELLSHNDNHHVKTQESEMEVVNNNQ